MRTRLLFPSLMMLLGLASLHCAGSAPAGGDSASDDAGASTPTPQPDGGTEATGGHDAGHTPGDDAGHTQGEDAGHPQGQDAGHTQGEDAGGSKSTDSGTSPPPPPPPPPSDGGTPSAAGRESWVWIYDNFSDNLTSVIANKASFTHVSPAFYTINYAYTSGVAYYTSCPTDSSGYDCTANGTNSFDGMTTKDFTTKATAAGIATVANIYAGAANGGTDTGVQSLLDNTGGAGDAFITAMTAEAVTNGYAGYALDWEVAQGAPIGASYAPKLNAFVDKFEAALAAHGMILGVAAIVSNVNGTWCSGNSGFLDFPTLASSSIDRVFIEDYVSDFGTASTSCQHVVLSSASPADCDYTLTGMMNMMCSSFSMDKAVIALDADPGSTNPIAGAAFSALQSYGFTKVAVWPQDPFMNDSGIVPSGGDWYDLLHTFLVQ